MGSVGCAGVEAGHAADVERHQHAPVPEGLQIGVVAGHRVLIDIHSIACSQPAVGDERCEVYQGYKPVCAALIRDRRASSSSSGAEPRLRPVKSDDDSGDEATGVPCEPSTIAHWFKTVITGNT